MVFPLVASHNYLLTVHVEGSEGDLRAYFLKKNALFLKIIVCIFANIRKKPYLCTIKIRRFTFEERRSSINSAQRT